MGQIAVPAGDGVVGHSVQCGMQHTTELHRLETNLMHIALCSSDLVLHPLGHPSNVGGDSPLQFGKRDLPRARRQLLAGVGELAFQILDAVSELSKFLNQIL